jgi:O-antigen ligase
MVLILCAGSKVRKRSATMFLIWSIPIIVLCLGLLLSDFRGAGDGNISAMSERFSSMFKGSKVYKSDSLEGRKLENKYALQKIAKQPLFGIGLGNDYRPPITDNDAIFTDATKYIHNGYLWILLNLGLIGLLPFLWFFTGFITRGFKHWERIKDTDMRALLAGFTLSVLGFLPINIVNPMIMQWFSIVVFSVAIGFGEVIIRINKKEMEN